MKKDKPVVPAKQVATEGKTGRKPGRPRVGGEPTFVRLDKDTLRRVAERQRALQEQNPVGHVCQSDALRALIVDGLDLVDGTHPLARAERDLSAAARSAEAVLNQVEQKLETADHVVALTSRVRDAALSLRIAIHGASAVVIALRGRQ